MSTMTKVFIVLTTISAVALSVLTVSYAAQVTNWRQFAVDAQTTAKAAIVERKSAEASKIAALAIKEDELRRMGAQRDEARKDQLRQSDENNGLRNELAAVRNELAALKASRKKVEELAGVQANQLASIQKQNQSLLSENIDLQTRNQSLQDRLSESTSELTLARDEIRNIQEKLIAAEQRWAGSGSAVVPGAGSVPANVGIVATPVARGDLPRAEIVDVAGNYASINAGENSGIVRGMTAMIFRGPNYLGDLQIDSVRPREAGGKLTTLVGDVRPGDSVKFVSQ